MIIKVSKRVYFSDYLERVMKTNFLEGYLQSFILDLQPFSTSAFKLLYILNTSRNCYCYFLMWESFKWSYIVYSAKKYQLGIHCLPSGLAFQVTHVYYCHSMVSDYRQTDSYV